MEATATAAITVQQAAVMLEVSYPKLIAFLGRKREWFPKHYDENRQRILTQSDLTRIRDNIS